MAAAILTFTLLGFFHHPGRTYLQQDTQIYLPILERAWDHTALSKDLIALYPHVAFTLYDEIAIGLRWLTGLDFEAVLALQQFVTRALGLFGIFLFARALRLSTRMALLVAGVFALGAQVSGPYVLTLELEPAPRAFAFPLAFLAMGLASRGWDVAAGAAGAAALLYHPPSSAPFWLVFFALTVAPARRAAMNRRIWAGAFFLGAVLALAVASRLQWGLTETQSVFSRIDPVLQVLQRLRAPYTFVSLWAPEWIWHYAFLWSASLAAFWRIRKLAAPEARFFLLGLPLIGALSVPLSYLLVERLGLALGPQLQPARAVLFVTLMAELGAAAAAIHAGLLRRYWECALWFLLAFAIPAAPRTLAILAGIDTPAMQRCALLVLELTALAVFAVWAEARGRRWAAAPWAAAVFAPFFLMPVYAALPQANLADVPEVHALANWARANTPRDAVFLFPDAGRELYPGAFRARALRAVYVDWKGGGQVNFLRDFGHEWWARWQRVGQGAFNPEVAESFAAYGVDYVVLERRHRFANRAPVFQTRRFLVYRP